MNPWNITVTKSISLTAVDRPCQRKDTFRYSATVMANTNRMPGRLANDTARLNRNGNKFAIVTASPFGDQNNLALVMATFLRKWDTLAIKNRKTKDKYFLKNPFLGVTDQKTNPYF